MGSGKTTLARELERLGWVRLSFAGPLKRMVKSFLENLVEPEIAEQMVHGDLKEVPIPIIGNRTPRYLMQTLGTEWGRELVDPDVWLTLAMGEAVTLLDRGTPVVFDDPRFINEAKAIVGAGGTMIRVIRPQHSVHDAMIQHASEGELDGFEHELEIVNHEGLEKVRETALWLHYQLT
jgi:hypothetical protein